MRDKFPASWNFKNIRSVAFTVTVTQRTLRFGDATLFLRQQIPRFHFCYTLEARLNPAEHFQTDIEFIARRNCPKETIISKLLWIQRSNFDSRRYQIFWEVGGLERGPLSLVSKIEELLGRKSSGFGLESR
jgi:hypothetical protein